MMPQKVWDFHVLAERVSDDPVRHRVVLTTASGTVIEREGWSPLYELIRAIGSQRKPDAEAAARDFNRACDDLATELRKMSPLAKESP